MKSTLNRIRSIYSVIASPNRLEILRIINTQGPLSYSELKTLAGFKSKKESGKFAYHLRKLVRQLLMTLNRQERKYKITNLGRLILNLTKQIEEHSIIESGKLYVRTSHSGMVEFNADKILQSLVKESDMPVELAQKITSETESRLQKFSTTYLTAPLIREIVNSLLIEHGHEDYRHKLTRLGLPVYDITELINKTSTTGNEIGTVLSKTANSVFAEYLLLSQIPRNVADAYLSGDIHLSNIGTWGLMPDTLFIDLTLCNGYDFHLNDKLLSNPRITTLTDNDLVANLCMLISTLQNEIVNELVIENIQEYFKAYSSNSLEDNIKIMKLCFYLISLNSNVTQNSLIISIFLNIDDPKYSNLTDSILDAYLLYVTNVPKSKIKLIISSNFKNNLYLEKITQIVNSGGFISISSNDNSCIAYSGIKKHVSPELHDSIWLPAIHSLSINLPRLAYDSNKDETYFRTKLAVILRISIDALITRKTIMLDMMKKGLLPALISGIPNNQYTNMSLIINLVGIKEALLSLTGDKLTSNSRNNLQKKIITTANKIILENNIKSDNKIELGILHESGVDRFYKLDSEKYGKNLSLLDPDNLFYTDVESINSSNNILNFNKTLTPWLYDNLKGAYSINIEIQPDITDTNFKSLLINASNSFPYFKLVKNIIACTNCGAKYKNRATRCSICKSNSKLQYQTK